MKTTVIFSLLFTGLIGSLCSQTQRTSIKSPAGYDLGKPVKYQMPAELLEISGIAFNNGDNNMIYAEQDEEGNIYYFRPGDQQVRHARFGKRGDYEDIAIAANRAVILRSDGTLYSMALKEVNSGQVNDIKTFKGLLPAGEYEGLYAGKPGNKLYALCKQCAGNKHDKESNGYILNIAADGAITNAGNFKIDVRKISALVNKNKLKFHPSALAKNPLTGQWYILSSVNKLLVVADANWNVQEAYPLNPNLFLQPEGMAFDNQGNLYISNEGNQINSGNIFLFKYAKGK